MTGLRVHVTLGKDNTKTIILMLDNTPRPTRKLTLAETHKAYAEAFSACTWGRPLSGPPLVELLTTPHTLSPRYDALLARSTFAKEETRDRTSGHKPDEPTG